MQLPLLTPNSTWTPPKISELPSWSAAKRVAIDTETCDPTLKTLGPGVRRGAYIVGYSFAIEDGPKYYIPLRHYGGGNVEDVGAAMGYLREQCAGFTGEIVGANLSYDLDFLAEENIFFPQLKAFRDVQVAEALIDELQMSFSLESICQKYLGVGKNEGLLREAANAYKVDPKKGLHLIPGQFVGAYAEDDANLPLLALRRQEKEIEAQDLWKIFNTESELLPVLVKMRRRGIRVDLDRLSEVEKWSAAEERKALEEIKHLTGVAIPFNSVWQATALVQALVSIGIKIPLTPKTKKPSIDKAFLKSINHPVAAAINRARRVNKVRTTFAQSIRDHLTNGKIHCVINQLRKSDDGDEDGEGEGARYGRCSSQNPNMQQQPSNDPEIGPLWKSIYVAEEGQYLCSADFSSQEPRHTIHYAAITKLGSVKVLVDGNYRWVDASEKAKEMAERYRQELSIDPHQIFADIIQGRPATPVERKQAKDIFLGLCYGMGGAKLCKTLGLPTMMAVRDRTTGRLVPAESEEGKVCVTQGGRIFESAGEEGQRLLDKFDAGAPFVRALSKVCERAATKNGYVRTGAGRKCRFPRDAMGNVDWAYKSLNRLIQGDSADQTKSSMIAADKAGFDMLLQVHDELIANVADMAEAERLGKVMVDCYSLCVPSKVDIAIGKSWGEAK
jgi:DNA polymerase I-like protein with 3'-5' exonuclease and polymerase domains